jgi:hypothetical protein
VGASVDGTVLYTRSDWWMRDPGVPEGGADSWASVSSINVLRLGDDGATIVYAVEVDPWASVYVDGDLAYVVRVEWPLYGLAYADASRDANAFAPSPASPPTTSLLIIDLAADGGPLAVGNLTLEGSYYHLLPEGGLAVLVSGDSFNVVVIEADAQAGLRVMGLYEVGTYVASIEVTADRLFLAQGVYGVAVLAI